MTHLITDIDGNDLSNLVELEELASGAQRVICRECGCSDLVSCGAKIRHAGWCESKPRVDDVRSAAEVAAEVAAVTARTDVELQAFAADVRRTGICGGDHDAVLEAHRLGYLSVSQAMNLDD